MIHLPSTQVCRVFHYASLMQKENLVALRVRVKYLSQLPAEYYHGISLPHLHAVESWDLSEYIRIEVLDWVC